MFSAPEVLRRLAAEMRLDGESKLADDIEGSARIIDRIDKGADIARARADHFKTARNALYQLAGCASRHATDAATRNDTAEARRAQSVVDGAHRDLAEMRRLDGMHTDGLTPSYREDHAPALTPTPTDYRNARGAARSRPGLSDKEREQFVNDHAARAASLRGHHERVEHERNETARRQDAAQREDMSKLDVGREKLAAAATMVKDASAAFDSFGDTADAQRVKAIATELEALAKSTAARADGARGMRPLPNATARTDSRGMRPLPNAALKGTP